MKIGIFGGTFDPIHNGHLIVAQETQQKLHLDKILFIPAKKPPHKPDIYITESHHRLRMVEMAINGNSGFDVSDIEINRQGLSYTIETLETLKSQGNLTLIMGHDSFQAIETWHRYLDIIRTTPIVAVIRPGETMLSFSNFSNPLRTLLHEHIIHTDVDSSDRTLIDNTFWRLCILKVP
ncbi:nicotinate (nicotinamide) nucleotide adenylyltransferase, partial [bacterium]|nr:nicotinate (nicotinamide) nucleotide adenylyltransferase [candidate division CSSED10-310 bacterium]